MRHTVTLLLIPLPLILQYFKSKMHNLLLFRYYSLKTTQPSCDKPFHIYIFFYLHIQSACYSFASTELL